MTYPVSNPVKELRLYVSGDRVLTNIPLFIQDNVGFNFSSSYSKIFDAGNDAVDFMGQIAGNISRGVTGGKLNLGFSSQNKFFGFQQWKGSDPVTFTMTLNFHMGLTKENSGYHDVYVPMMTLVQLALPYEDPAGILLPPSGQLLDLLIKVGQKDTSALINFAAPGSATAKNFNESSEAFARKFSSSFISIRVGNMAFLPWAIVKRAEPNFGKEFDSDGFPITGTITLEISSAFVATKSLINYWMTQATQEAASQSPMFALQQKISGVSPQTAWTNAFRGNALDGGASKWSTGGN